MKYGLRMSETISPERVGAARTQAPGRQVGPVSEGVYRIHHASRRALDAGQSGQDPRDRGNGQAGVLCDIKDSLPF